MKNTDDLESKEEEKTVPLTLPRRIIKHFFQNITEGLTILVLIGLVIYVGQILISTIRPAITWLSSVIGANIQRQILVVVGTLIVGAYLVGYISKRKNLAKKVASRIPILRNVVFDEIHDGQPCLIIPNEKTFIQAIYRGNQLIEILGKNPRNCRTSRIAFPTYPIPISGFAHFIAQDLVYIVTNVSLSKWLANDMVALAREIKPSIQTIPISEYLKKRNSQNNSRKRHT